MQKKAYTYGFKEKVSSGLEAPLNVKDVIHQISCFSKTTVMNIRLTSVGRTSALGMTYDHWL